jgi:class 3 adenylate cyclase
VGAAVTDPAIVHADGTDCHHEGDPQRLFTGDDGPECPAGVQVTHMRVNGRTLTFAEAHAALKSIADAWVKALSPVITAFAELGRRVSDDPAIRALAAAAAIVDEERQGNGFACPCCGEVMRQPADIENRYCGRCHWYTGDPELGAAHMAGECAAREGATSTRQGG